jgi:hypothetical protein
LTVFTKTKDGEVFGEAKFPEGTTGAYFATVGKKDGEFKLKHELSSQRKREMRSQEEEKVANK